MSHSRYPLRQPLCGRIPTIFLSLVENGAAHTRKRGGTRLIYTPLYATQPCEGGYPLFRENQLAMWGNPTAVAQVTGTRQIPLMQLHIAAEHWKQDKQYSSPYISLYIYSQAKNNPEHTLPPCPAAHRSLTADRACHTACIGTPLPSRIILYY